MRSWSSADLPGDCLLGWYGRGAAAGKARGIERRDNSMLSGEVVDFAGGRYLVESPALGRIAIDQAGIRSLQPGGAPGGGNGRYGAQIMVLRQPLMGDAGIRGMITPQQSDPHAQAALADDEQPRLAGRAETDDPAAIKRRSLGYWTKPSAPQPMTTQSSGSGCLNSPPSRIAHQRRQ
jgi:hypothetical protein